MTFTRMATIVTSRRALGAFVMAVVFLIASVLFGPAVSIGQEGETSTAEPPRPKVDEIATVDLSFLGILGYSPPVFIQPSKTPEDKLAHVYYTPVVGVVTDKGKIRNHIKEDGELILFFRLEGDVGLIEGAVRDKLVVMAKENDPAFKIEQGTKPYRVDVLPISEARFTVSDRRGFVSERVKASFRENGDIPIHFYLASAKEAEEFVEDLQNGNVSLVFEYGFAGVSDETCTARLEASQVQDIGLFKKVIGEGGKGKVARHQVVDIADQIASRWKLVSRCADYAMASELADSVLEALGGSETVDVANWDKLEELIAFDRDSFRADIETGMKNLEKTVTRHRLERAWSDAYSEAKSEASEGGGGFSIGAVFKKIPFKLGFGASGSKANASSEARASAMRDFQDILRKQGVSTEWDGERFIPKSVDVHSTSALRSAWGKAFEKTISLTSGENGKHEVILTKEAWTEVIPPEKERQIDSRLEAFGEDLARIDHRVNKATAQQRNLENSVNRQVRNVRNDMRDALRVQTCYYEFNVKGGGTNNYFHDLRRDDDVAILSGIGGCSKLDWATMDLLRLSKDDDDWGLFVQGLPRPCEFWASIVYLDGTNINESRTHRNGRSGYGRLSSTKQWCH